MHKFSILSVACAILATPAASQTSATTTPTAIPIVKPSAMIVSVDGRRIGHVDTVRGDSAMIIYNGQFVAVPLSTISLKGDRLVTSLKLSEITGR